LSLCQSRAGCPQSAPHSLTPLLRGLWALLSRLGHAGRSASVQLSTLSGTQHSLCVHIFDDGWLVPPQAQQCIALMHCVLQAPLPVLASCLYMITPCAHSYDICLHQFSVMYQVSLWLSMHNSCLMLHLLPIITVNISSPNIQCLTKVIKCFRLFDKWTCGSGLSSTSYSQNNSVDYQTS
jgi:hypothetical protein